MAPRLRIGRSSPYDKGLFNINLENTMKTLPTLLISTLLAGCSNTATIRSVPDGAKVDINGAFQGYTPLSYKHTCKTFGDDPTIALSKADYHTAQGTLDYEVSWFNVAADTVLFWPMLFVNTSCLKDQYNFILDDKK